MKKWNGLKLILNIKSISYFDRESWHPVTWNGEEKFHFVTCFYPIPTLDFDRTSWSCTAVSIILRFNKNYVYQIVNNIDKQ